MITVWEPARCEVDAAQFLERIERMTSEAAAPFDPEFVALLGRISAQILSNPATKSVPQYVALAYWMRPAALKRLVDGAESEIPQANVVGARGLALHLPPVNVDTIFVYSWALSVLAGNANIVRLPASIPPQGETLIRIIVEALMEAQQDARHLFCSYPYGGDLERDISRTIDLRIIWGGDAKVDAVSRVPIRPDGLSIGFPDRHSLALLSAPTYLRTEPTQRDELARRLFNDAYWFDQMGCSSPRLLAWIGGQEQYDDLSADLYGRLETEIERKSYTVDPAVAVAKLGLSNDMLASGVAKSATRYSSELEVATVTDPVAALKETAGGGYFSQCYLGNLDEAQGFVGRKLQTITHFGFDRDELMRLAHSIAGKGGYRIVPVGQALDFDAVWDGVPLLGHFTRRTVVKA